MDQELDNWTNYVSCRWIDIPDPSPTGPLLDFLDLIPDSDPGSAAAASGEDARRSEEDLASVPSTVLVGLPGTSYMEEDSSPVKSPGGTWRSSDGSWSRKNFTCTDDEEAPREAPPELLSAPNLRVAPQSCQLLGKGGRG